MMMIPEKLEECPDCGASGIHWAYDAQYCGKCGYNALRSSAGTAKAAVAALDEKEDG